MATMNKHEKAIIYCRSVLGEEVSQLVKSHECSIEERISKGFAWALLYSFCAGSFVGIALSLLAIHLR